MTRPKRLPPCLTPQEYFALTSWAPTDPLALRNLCMIRLMVNAGLRSQEVLGAKRQDIDMLTGQLLVTRAKGGRQRVVWVNDDDLRLVGQWLIHRDEIIEKYGHGEETDALFVTRAGRPMSSRNLRKMVKAVAFCVGIGRDVHPHMLRHTFATDLLRETRNLRLTQRALGHAHIATTTIHTHIVDEELEAAMKGLRSQPRHIHLNRKKANAASKTKAISGDTLPVTATRQPKQVTPATTTRIRQKGPSRRRS